MSSSTSKGPSRSSTPTSRILRELSSYTPTSTLPSLMPSPSSLLNLSAILSGTSFPPSTGYSSGRWLLCITVPTTYPNQPPEIKFVTKICHPNVSWETGEVCLDVLKERWTPVLGVVGALESVGALVGGEAGVDSPLGVEVAALERGGDWIGARSLIGYWCQEERFDGELEEEGMEKRLKS